MNGIAGTGVATFASSAFIDAESTETGNLKFVACEEEIGNDFDDRGNGLVSLSAREAGFVGNSCNKFSLVHEKHPFIKKIENGLRRLGYSGGAIGRGVGCGKKQGNTECLKAVNRRSACRLYVLKKRLNNSTKKALVKP